jgi:hypothetical protein
MNSDIEGAAGRKPALSVVEMERVLVAAAQNFPATSDVMDVSIEVRHGEWFVAACDRGRDRSGDVGMTDVVDRLRQVFTVVA